MIRVYKGTNIFGYMKDYTVFDLETTGLDTENDAIVEIGAIRVRNHEIAGSFATLVNPECHIPEEVTQIHGITDNMVADSPKIKDALEMFNSFVDRDILVGQNIAAFDMPFIWRYSKKCFDGYIANDYVDNLTVARFTLPELKSHSMSVLVPMFAISEENLHRAYDDCKRTMEVYEIIGRMITWEVKNVIDDRKKVLTN